MHPDQGSNPQPTNVPRLGIKPSFFWCMGRSLNQLSHPARAAFIFYLSLGFPPSLPRFFFNPLTCDVSAQACVWIRSIISCALGIIEGYAAWSLWPSYRAVALLSNIPPTFHIDSEGPADVFDRFYSCCVYIIFLFYIDHSIHKGFQVVAEAWHRVGAAKHLVNE